MRVAPLEVCVEESRYARRLGVTSISPHTNSTNTDDHLAEKCMVERPTSQAPTPTTKADPTQNTLLLWIAAVDTPSEPQPPAIGGREGRMPARATRPHAPAHARALRTSSTATSRARRPRKGAHVHTKRARAARTLRTTCNNEQHGAQRAAARRAHPPTKCKGQCALGPDAIDALGAPASADPGAMISGMRARRGVAAPPTPREARLRALGKAAVDVRATGPRSTAAVATHAARPSSRPRRCGACRASDAAVSRLKEVEGYRARLQCRSTA